jgi:RNA polymerase sigma factor (sigma-70 family)
LSTATPSLSDSRLTRRAARGSNRAFEAIFERYHQELYRYCAAIVGNSADAQDAVQNTMVKVLRALPGEERRIELRPWLYRIAHNEAIEIVRRRVPAEEIDAESLLAPASAADQVLARERLRHLVADVAELPERQRGALVMRELGGLGFEEIGAALGTTAATARQTLYEARLGLRRMSEGREMDCAEAMRSISDGDRRLLRGRKLRAHLRSCEGCRAFRAEIEGRSTDLAMVAPLPAAAVAGILQGVLGGAGGGAAGAGAGAAASAAGGAAGKSLLSAAALKSAAAVGVVVAIGVTAADQRGLIHVGSGGSESPPAKSAPAPASGAAADPGASSPQGAARRVQAATGPTGADAKPGSGLTAGRPAEPSPAAALPHEPAPLQPPPASAAAESPPQHADNGRHLGQVKHPDHGHGAASAAGESPGKSDAAPGHVKPHHAKHEPAPANVPPGQAKKSAPAESPAAEPAHPAQPTHPETPAVVGEPPAEAHGKSAAEPTG